MSLFGVLGTGASGMRAGTAGAQTASQNIANANTDGYSRQRLDLEALGPRPLAGVRTNGSRRVVDRLVERRLLGANASAGEGAARSEALASLDDIFATGPGSIDEALAALGSAFQDLSAMPGDGSARQSVLAAAERLAVSFQTAGGSLSDARADINSRISAEVGETNTALREIADLGAQIAEQESSGQEAAELRDRRDSLLRDVSRSLPVRVIDHEGGAVTVLLAGQKSLVTPDGRVNELIAVPDATSGDVNISLVSAGAPEDVTSLISSGRIAGLVEARDGAIADAEAGLDQLASDVATAYNGAHAAGYGMDAVAGRNLFDFGPSVAGAAESFAVSADVAGEPGRIAAAGSAAAAPGDNINALAMVDLSSQSFAAGGTATANAAYASLVGAAGSAAQSANRAMEHTAAVADQIAAVRDSVSGVSTDEEMISLMQFQRSYQGALRVVQVADEMLAELMAMKR